MFISPNQTLQPDTVQPSLNISWTVVNNGTFLWTWTGPGVDASKIKSTDSTIFYRQSILMLARIISATDARKCTCTAIISMIYQAIWIQGLNKKQLYLTM